jgi:hypothetical protein
MSIKSTSKRLTKELRKLWLRKSHEDKQLLKDIAVEENQVYNNQIT